MYQISEVYTALKGLVGWRQSTNTDYDIVDATNLASSSGMYYQDYSAMVTIENVNQSQNDKDITDDNFNTMLENMERASINKIMRAVFTEDDIISDKIMFPFEADWIAGNALTNDTSFVGYEVDVSKRGDLAMVLNSIFLAFNGVDTVKIIMFHSSQNALLESQEITTVGNSDVKTALNWQLPSLKYAGGKYYIGYLRSGLTASAVNRNYDIANVSNCYRIATVRPIKVDAWDAETMFDVNDIEYTDEYWGLNFDFSEVKDYTNFILQNKNKFVEAMGLQMAADCLDLIIHSNRSNRAERSNDRNLAAHANLELNGTPIGSELPPVVGILRKLKAEIKRLRTNLIETSLMEVYTLS